MNQEFDTSTIQRALAIIELFLGNPDGLTPQEIQDATSISRSTLFNLLKTLKELGCLEQNEARGRYFPGVRLAAWNASGTFSFQAVINAFQQESNAHPCSETLALAAPAPQGLLILDQKESPQRIRAVYIVGEPLLPDSAAHALFAPQPAEDLIENGYLFIENPEYFELILPLCQNGIKPNAVLLFHAPAYRWQKQELLDTWLPGLRAMAARISHRMGAFFYSPFQFSENQRIQPTSALTIDQTNQFLQGPWAARLACVRPDGHPHVIPVWQEWDGTAFYIPAWSGSQWIEYVRQNDQVSLTIDEPWTPLRRVVVRGKTIPVSNMPQQERDNLLKRLALRYLGQNTPTGLQHQVETIFIIHPDSIRGWSGLPIPRGVSHAH
ncbi:MAG: hypothetical protein CVU39_23780 [Chloroflexi bacterium HGW-Chloroflexi-10]|nr:MAG: hypothetical protein CVU39_23780 [Chloroflexi bacterium HGW-Chloroflexi-10]